LGDLIPLGRDKILVIDTRQEPDEDPMLVVENRSKEGLAWRVETPI
jgi:hypothetical protein